MRPRQAAYRYPTSESESARDTGDDATRHAADASKHCCGLGAVSVRSVTADACQADGRCTTMT